MRPEERSEHSASGKEAKNEGGAGAAAETVRGLEGNLPWVHPHRDINFELWTQKFVGASGNLDAVLLDAFLPNETFASQVELYPNKLLNLQQRTLRMGSVTYVPYTVTNYVVSNCRLSLYLSLLFPTPTPHPSLSYVVFVFVVVIVVVGFIARVALGTPKAHTNVGDLHAGIKQSQLVTPFQPLPSHAFPALSTAWCPLVVLESSV